MRNLPFINYAEQSSDEDEYDSAEEVENELVSPRRPRQSVTASPRALLQPDPPLIEEVLESVSEKLKNLPLSDLGEPEGEEIVETGLVVGHQISEEVEAGDGPIMPDNNAAAAAPVDFDVENAEDGDKAQEHAR